MPLVTQHIGFDIMENTVKKYTKRSVKIQNIHMPPTFLNILHCSLALDCLPNTRKLKSALILITLHVMNGF